MQLNVSQEMGPSLDGMQVSGRDIILGNETICQLIVRYHTPGHMPITLEILLSYWSAMQIPVFRGS